MYSFGDLHTPPPHQRHVVMATETETRMVSKRAVCILLECCLVVGITLVAGKWERR